MPNPRPAVSARQHRILDTLLFPGRIIFSLAFAAIGVETLVFARTPAFPLGPGYSAISVIPWVPAIPLVAAAFGIIWIACAVGLLFKRAMQSSAFTLAGLLTLCTLTLILPKYVLHPEDMGLRTVVFEPLSLACIALLMLDRGAAPPWLLRLSRWVLGIGMVVFGVDHFLGLGFIAALLPDWIPWHAFWVIVFGVVMMAVGIVIVVADLAHRGNQLPSPTTIGSLERWGLAAYGTMFAIWVVTLHLPRTLGLYSIPGARTDPNEWSSLLIAVGLWGGSWALAANKRDANKQAAKERGE